MSLRVREHRRTHPVQRRPKHAAPTAPARSRKNEEPRATGKPAHRPTADSARSGKARHLADLTAQQLAARADRAAPGRLVTNADGSHTFRAGRGNNDLLITEDASGAITIRDRANHRTYRLSAEDASAGVRIDGGRGNDRIEVRSRKEQSPFFGGAPSALNVSGGRGDDRIDATRSTAGVILNGGRGRDTVLGGRGDDHLLGGRGEDRLFGRNGTDRLSGDAGNDRLLGGRGGDRLRGGTGDDHLRGQDGSDAVSGNGGRDRVFGGRGADAIYADRSDRGVDAGGDRDEDVIIAQDGAIVPTRTGANDRLLRYNPTEVQNYLAAHPELRLRGDAASRERTRADLGVMLRTDQGRGLLEDLTRGLRTSGRTLNIGDLDEQNGHYIDRSSEATVGEFAFGDGFGATHRPVNTLFHELVHAYQYVVTGAPQGRSRFADGRMVNNVERQATGLSYIDESGRVRPDNELPYTDNRFRAELGVILRAGYGSERGPPLEYLPPAF